MSYLINPFGGTPVDPFFANVVLLCHCDGIDGSASFTDMSSYANTLSPFLTTVSTTAPKFGTGSADFTTIGGSRIETTNFNLFQFGAGQFTVEAWAYFTSTPTAIRGVLSQFGGSSNLGWFLGTSSGNLNFYYSTTGTNSLVVGASYSPTLNTWVHLAADRDASNVLRVYTDGAVIASATVASTFFASTQVVCIGNDKNVNRNFFGRLDDIRVTKGTARYAGAFTPPIAAFPNR